MTITVQALQADGTWSVRNAFVTENAQVISGAMKASDLEAKARKVMSQWQQTAPDGKQLRVHNSETDKKAVAVLHWAGDPEGETSTRIVGDLTRLAPGHVEGARAGIIEALGGPRA